ncbi:MAG: homocysteine S-methyltransferase family protein [Acidobacteriota bacterium]
MDVLRTVGTAPWILLEGAVVERLRRDPAVRLDPHVVHAGLVLSAAGRLALGRIYEEYLAIGREAGVPLILLTPTWRSNPERLRAAGLEDSDVNGKGVRFLRDLRGACGPYGDRVLILGLMGSRGDAYRPEEGLPAEEAEVFHGSQAEALARAGVDGFQAATQCTLPEALGLCRALARTGRPYVASYVVRPTGHLLDGTPLEEAVDRVDQETPTPPLLHMLNCVHARNAAAALWAAEARVGGAGLRNRLQGIQANTSPLSPEELDGRPELDAESPESFGAGLLDLHRRFGLRLLGGCCGSDGRHLRALVHAMAGRGTG